MRIPFLGGEVDLGSIPAVVEGTVMAINDVPSRIVNARTIEASFEIGVYTMAGAMTISYYSPTAPVGLEVGKQYRFAVGITNNDYGKAIQPRVRLASFSAIAPSATAAVVPATPAAPGAAK